MTITTTRPPRPKGRAAGRTGTPVAPRTAPAPAPKTEPKAPATKTRAADTGAARARVSAVRAANRTPRAPFVLLIVGLLGGALVSLLLLNTVLAKDAFTLGELQQSNKLLSQQRQQLQEDIAREESPANLAQRAKALGMVEPTRPAFVDAKNGKVIGGSVRPVPHEAAAAAGAAGVLGIPGAIVPGVGIPGWTGVQAPPPAAKPGKQPGTGGGR